MPLTVELRCSGCGRTIGREPGGPPCDGCGQPVSLREGSVLRECAACGEPRLYRRKDLNRRTGVAVVAVGAALSLAALPFSPLLAYAVLFGMAGIDAVFYLLLPSVAVCYRCKAKHRGYDPGSDIKPFDLLTADLIDQQIRDAGGNVGTD